MACKGVFQIDRNIFNNEIWSNIAEFRIFFYILGNAVWKEEGIKKGEIHIKRGQYLRSYRNLREDLVYMENNALKYYSLSNIKKTIDKLIADGRIKKEDTKLGTLFTVCNYELYQGFERFQKENTKGDENGERTEKERRENNKKKDNKDKKIIIMSDYEEQFIKTLHLIKGWPCDIVKDLDYLKTLEERYPRLDLIAAVEKFSDYILDKPFKKNSNHRSQLNTSCSKYLEWGICLKDHNHDIPESEIRKTDLSKKRH